MTALVTASMRRGALVLQSAMVRRSALVAVLGVAAVLSGAVATYAALAPGFDGVAAAGVSPAGDFDDGAVPAVGKAPADGTSAGHVGLTQASGSYVPAATWVSAGGRLPAGAWVEASGIDMADDGRVFVADAGEARITVIETDDSVGVVVPPSAGPGDGLVSPRHIAVDSAAGRLYVADQGADAVKVFGLDGAPLASWTGVQQPVGVAVAPDGTVVAASAATGRVHRFAADGTELAAWPGIDTGTGARVRAIDVDADGSVYVLDGTGRLLRVFDSGGTLVSDITVRLDDGPVQAFDIDVDYLPQVSSTRRIWLATSRGLVQHVPETDGWRWNPLGNDLAAVVVDRARGVYVATRGPVDDDQVGGRVMRLDYAAAMTGAAERTWSGSILRSGEMSGPEVIDLGADGVAYVLDRGRRVQRFDLGGAPLGQLEELNPAAV
ncbi:MAG: NHL repeat-containing protein, partial [Anaerolineae bacterium]